jgi:ATP-dependent helicase HrpA
MTIRLDKFSLNPERDETNAAAIGELWKRYQERSDKLRKAGEAEPALEDFRWQVEELRVSLFAQELRTPFPVSVKRLNKIWGAVVR